MDVYESRMAKLRQGMETSGLDLLVIYSNGCHSFLASDAVRYVTGFKPMGPHSAVLLPRDGDPILILTPALDSVRAKKRSAVKRLIATDDFAADFARAVSSQRLHPCKAGVIGGWRMTRGTRDLINSQFTVPLAAFDEEFDNIARARDQLELQLSERAAEIAERGYARLLEVVRPGMLEYELAGEVECYMKSLGADDNFQLMSASQHNLAVRAPSDRRLDVGDVILAEISPSVEGQFVQICRTAVIGPATDIQREKYQLLIDAMLAGMRAGVPGTTVREVVQAMNEVVTRAGYGKYCFPPYMRARGHGLGLGSASPGDLMLENETRLVAGMTFVIHPNQYIPETGYFLVGEPVVVTDAGLKPLTRRQPGLDSILR